MIQNRQRVQTHNHLDGQTERGREGDRERERERERDTHTQTRTHARTHTLGTGPILKFTLTYSIQLRVISVLPAVNLYLTFRNSAHLNPCIKNWSIWDKWGRRDT